MKWLRDGYTLEELFERVRTARDRVLLTDFDGTLAPFVNERQRAQVYPGLTELIEEIARAPRSRFIVISGRSLQDLERLFQLETAIERWGTHGWEQQRVDGERTIWPISQESREALYEVIAWAEKEGLITSLEVKPATVALHWRGTEAKVREQLMERAVKVLKPIAAKAGLELHEFDGGCELRVPGRSKGKAVQNILQLMDRESFMFAYLGDDRTDEDAFEVIGERGLRVLVRTELRETKADLWLRPPRELEQFLRRWNEALRG